MVFYGPVPAHSPHRPPHDSTPPDEPPSGHAPSRGPAGGDHPNLRLSRRRAFAGLAALAAVGGLSVAGCTSNLPTKTPAQLLAADPLGPMYAETRALITQYDQALVAMPTLVGLLGPLREEHRQHLTALASLVGLPTPSVTVGPNPSGVPLPGAPSSTGSPVGPAPSSPPASVQGPSSVAPTGSATGPSTSASPSASAATTLVLLSTAEKTAQTHAVAACVAAPFDRVAVLASIAACLATHVAALR